MWPLSNWVSARLFVGRDCDDDNDAKVIHRFVWIESIESAIGVNGDRGEANAKRQGHHQIIPFCLLLQTCHININTNKKYRQHRPFLKSDDTDGCIRRGERVKRRQRKSFSSLPLSCFVSLSLSLSLAYFSYTSLTWRGNKRRDATWHTALGNTRVSYYSLSRVFNIFLTISRFSLF